MRGLLSALSLLFHGGGGGGTEATVQPSHKSVYNFLRDPERAGPHAVDVREGLAVLAMSCLRLRGPASGSSWAADYARAQGQAHLVPCAMAAKDVVACHEA